MQILPGTDLGNAGNFLRGLRGESADWSSGSYTGPDGQKWYWDALHGWLPEGMTMARPNDPAIIKKYFKSSTPTGPPPPLDPASPYNQPKTNPKPDLQNRLQQLLQTNQGMSASMGIQRPRR